MAINFNKDNSGLINLNRNIDNNQMAFVPQFIKNMFTGNPEDIQLGEEGSPLDKTKDFLQENKEKQLPTPEEIEGKTSFLDLPSNNLTAMAISNYDKMFGDKTFTDINTLPFNVNEVTSDGITNNVKFRDMLFNDLRSLPSDLRTSLGTTKDALTKDFSGLKSFATNLKDKGIDLGSLAISSIGNLIAPGVGFVLQNLKETPEQRAIKEFYENEFGLTNTGQIASGIMQGYNPVYGFGGAGLGKAIDKRLATILKTEERKKKKGLELSQELINRRKELEALKAQEQRAANTAAGAFKDTVQLDPGGGSWKGQTAAKEKAGVSVAGPGFGRGAYFAKGGIVSL